MKKFFIFSHTRDTDLVGSLPRGVEQQEDMLTMDTWWTPAPVALCWFVLTQDTASNPVAPEIIKYLGRFI